MGGWKSRRTDGVGEREPVGTASGEPDGVADGRVSVEQASGGAKFSRLRRGRGGGQQRGQPATRGERGAGGTGGSRARLRPAATGVQCGRNPLATARSTENRLARVTGDAFRNSFSSGVEPPSRSRARTPG